MDVDVVSASASRKHNITKQNKNKTVILLHFLLKKTKLKEQQPNKTQEQYV